MASARERRLEGGVWGEGNDGGGGEGHGGVNKEGERVVRVRQQLQELELSRERQQKKPPRYLLSWAGCVKERGAEKKRSIRSERGCVPTLDSRVGSTLGHYIQLGIYVVGAI